MIATTLLFVTVITLLATILSLNVSFRRGAAGITIGDGGDAELQRRIRAHANLAEHAPLALAALAAAELTGANPNTILALGIALVAGRISHAIGMLQGVLWPRPVGMVLTHTPTIIASILTLWALLA